MTEATKSGAEARASQEADLRKGSPLVSASLTVLLIRHGETVLNAESRFRGHSEVDLNERGRRQAGALARSLPSFGPSHVFSSPLKRCLETAGPLAAAAGLAVIVEPRLIDLDYGAWQERRIAEVAAEHPREYAAWMAGDLSLQFPRGELLQDVVDRLRSFLDEIVERHQGGVVALVTHNVLCQIATRLLTDAPPESFQSVRHDPGNFSVFRWREGAGRADGLNLSP